MEHDKSLTITRRLRPVRLAFLVRPSDRAGLRKILQINTVIWGGGFNSIIPVFGRVPKHLAEPGFTARKVISGYLESFLPDFVVAMQPELTSLLSFPKDRLLQPEDVLSLASSEPVRYGLDVRHLYFHIYEQEFKFHRRDTVKVLVPTINRPSLRLFSGACFGEFPEESVLQDFQAQYTQLFDATRISITADHLFESLELGTLNPRRITVHGLDLLRLPVSDDPVLFYMNPESAIDIIDFWNLRALGRSVLPVPAQWRSQLQAGCEEFLRTNFVPSSQNPSFWHGTTLMCSRSLNPQEMLDFARSLARPDATALSCQTTYPRFWENPTQDSTYGWGVTVTARTEDEHVDVRNDRMEFRDIGPTFVANTWGRGSPRWINVISISDFSDDPESVRTLPDELGDWNDVVQDIGRERSWVTREGIILACNYDSWRHYWRTPTSFRVFRAWMRERGYEMTVSSAGRSAREILRRLGRYGLWPFARLELLKELNSMAHGEIEVDVPAVDGTSTRRKVRSPALSRRKLLDLLKRISDNDADNALRKLALLTEKEVLRLGLRVQCIHCQQFNWYSVDELKLALKCQRCLRDFSFPSAAPPEEWYYRSIGPFATENFAQGGYTVALTLHALGSRLRGDVTWVPSIEMEASSGKKLEADFAMFWKDDLIDSTPSRLIMGECKSLNRFEVKDTTRMEELGSAFPSSVLAFCTLRERLEPDEKRRIARLVKARSFLGSRSSNTVIVLTGLELLGTGMPECWDNIPGVTSGYPGRGRVIEEVAAITQKLHLES